MLVPRNVRRQGDQLSRRMPVCAKNCALFEIGRQTETHKNLPNFCVRQSQQTSHFPIHIDHAEPFRNRLFLIVSRFWIRDSKASEPAIPLIYLPKTSGDVITDDEKKARLSTKWQNLSSYASSIMSIYETTLVVSDWQNSKCTCPEFFLDYTCVHILDLAIRQKLTVVPDMAKPLISGCSDCCNCGGLQKPENVQLADQ